MFFWARKFPVTVVQSTANNGEMHGHLQTKGEWALHMNGRGQMGETQHWGSTLWSPQRKLCFMSMAPTWSKILKNNQLPGDSWRWQTGNGRSSHCCWPPLAQEARSHWWATRGGKLFVAQGWGNGRRQARWAPLWFDVYSAAPYTLLQIKPHIAPDFSVAFCLRPHEAFAARMKITMFTCRQKVF